MSLAEEIRSTLAWIDAEHRSARSLCENLMEINRTRPPGQTVEDARESMKLAVEVAAATARLETWNELRASLLAQLGSLV